MKLGHFESKNQNDCVIDKKLKIAIDREPQRLSLIQF